MKRVSILQTVGGRIVSAVKIVRSAMPLIGLFLALCAVGGVMGMAFIKVASAGATASVEVPIWATNTNSIAAVDAGAVSTDNVVSTSVKPPTWAKRVRVRSFSVTNGSVAAIGLVGPGEVQLVQGDTYLAPDYGGWFILPSATAPLITKPSVIAHPGCVGYTAGKVGTVVNLEFSH
jgi:hypothetical protein